MLEALHLYVSLHAIWDHRVTCHLAEAAFSTLPLTIVMVGT